MSLIFSLVTSVETGHPARDTCVIFSANVTHNLAPMWKQAGIYPELYEREGAQASSLIRPLTDGLAYMQAHPDIFRALNPANGWGDYAGALDWLRTVRAACRRYPRCIVSVSR